MLFYLSLIFVLSCFLGALLTPAIFDLILYIWPQIPWPFSRVLDRVFLAAILILLYIFRKKLSLQELRERFTNPGWKTAASRLMLGMFLAIGSSLVVIFILVNQGVLVAKDYDRATLYFKILAVIPAALIISVLEESFFRVLLLSALRRSLSLVPAIILASLIYACLHFIAPDKKFAFESGNLWQGFYYLTVVVQNALQFDLIAPFIGLLLIGVLLNVVMLNCQTIIFCIGLHAGWVFILKTTKYLFNINAVLPDHVLASRYFLVGQPLVWGSFVGVLLIALLLKRSGYFKKVELR